MKKIVVNPSDFDAIEVRLNGSIGPRMGMNSLSYRQMVMQEQVVLSKLTQILLSNELPKIVTILAELHPGFQSEKLQQRIGETLKVINKVSHLMVDGFHVAIVSGILDITCGHGGGFGQVFCSRFQSLCDKDYREDFWGTRWELPCFIALGLLSDLMANVDIDNPTAEDLKKSKVIDVASVYLCPQQTIDDFIAAYSVA